VSHIAGAQGYSSQHGVALRAISVESGPDVVASLMSRSPTAAQTGNLALEPVAAMIAAGSDPVVLATLITTSDHVKLVSFKSTGITDDPRTLRGKRIGVVLDTIGESYLDRLLGLAHLERSDILLVNSRPTEIRAALVRGDLDVGVLWDPFVPQAIRLYERARASHSTIDRGGPVVLVRPGLFTTYLNVVTTRRYLITSRPALVALLRSMLDAEHYISTDRARARALVESWLGLQAGDLRDFFGTAQFAVQLNVTALQVELKKVLQHLKGKDPGARDPGDLNPYIDTSLLAEIDPRLVSP
jgi:ABC-type nitrate/sulfonate/bicarbonate transport system substrate-binding protein